MRERVAWRDVVPNGVRPVRALRDGFADHTRALPAAVFRPGPAYAKAGRERYGLHPATEHWFAMCLAQGDETATPVTARAARIYLDIAFFHPTTTATPALPGLYFSSCCCGSVVRRADDAADLARLIHGVAAATRRRRLRQRLYSGVPRSPVPPMGYGT